MTSRFSSRANFRWQSVECAFFAAIDGFGIHTLHSLPEKERTRSYSGR